jgi:hypothetical protein
LIKPNGMLCAGTSLPMADLLTLNDLLERTTTELDRNADDLRHENSDVTDVMNWVVVS